MGTEQEITVQAAGLFDSGNNPYALPPGALLVASDVEITRDNVLQGRRGMAKASATQFVRFANFKDSVFAVLTFTFKPYWAQSPFTSWTAYTATSVLNARESTSLRSWASEAARCLYYPSSSGVGRIDSVGGTPVFAGVPPGMDVEATVGAAGSAVKGQTRVAYRVVFGRKDANGRLTLGAPSGRVIFTNTNASTTTNDVKVTVTLPYGAHGLLTGDFIQVYRTSGSVDIAATTDPGDECYLVSEVAAPAAATIVTLSRTGSTVTATTSADHGFVVGQYVATTDSGNINFPGGNRLVATTPATNQFTYTEAGTATTVGSLSVTAYPITYSVTDSQPDGTGGASLYTNPTQETILNQNARPPVAGDSALFGDCLWFADVGVLTSAAFTMLAVPSASSALSILGQAYSGGVAEDPTTFTFKRYTTGTTSENIRDTTASLCRVLNRTLGGDVIASIGYTPTTPGAFTLTLGFPNSDLPFVITQPAAIISTGGSTTVTLKHDRANYRHGLVYSKPNQPDHISQALAAAPLLVGAAHEPIKRIVPTRGALFVLKNDGVWKVTGQGGDFQVNPLDPTTSILAPESALALDNNVYCLTDQGVVRISESGVEVISRPIEQTIRDHFDSTSIAAASEADHKYRLWCGTRCVVFDPWTKTWTERSEPFLDSTITAVLNERTTGRLLVSGTSSVGARTGTYVENVSTLGDSLGETVAISTADQATTQNTYNVTHAASTLAVGDTLELSTCSAEVIQATDSTHSIVLATEMPAAGTYAIYRKTGARTVSWQIRPSKPGTLNEWQELVFQFLANIGQRATVNLATDFVTSGATNIDLDLIQTRLTNGDGFNQIRVWPAREDSLSAVLVATLSWASSRADIRLAGLTTRFVPSSWQVSR